MRGIVIVGFICGLGVGIAGCANPNTRPTHLEFGTSINDTVVMGPALRMVMERDRQISEYQPPLPTICTEPSPDVAIAFSRSLSGQGNFSEPNGPTVGGNFNAQASVVILTHRPMRRRHRWSDEPPGCSHSATAFTRRANPM